MNRKLGTLFVLLGLVIIVALALAAPRDPGAGTSAIDPAYQKSFDQWKAEQVDDLKQNWLVLAGLFWLKPGENSFGRDAGNTIVFPKGPAHAGVLELKG